MKPGLRPARRLDQEARRTAADAGARTPAPLPPAPASASAGVEPTKRSRQVRHRISRMSEASTTASRYDEHAGRASAAAAISFGCGFTGHVAATPDKRKRRASAAFAVLEMVPEKRLELPTRALRMRCSTS